MWLAKKKAQLAPAPPGASPGISMGRGAPREVLGGNRDSGSPSTATNFMIFYEHELRPNHLTTHFFAPRLAPGTQVGAIERA